jgi:hypothetical protein
VTDLQSSAGFVGERSATSVRHVVDNTVGKSIREKDGLVQENSHKWWECGWLCGQEEE